MKILLFIFLLVQLSWSAAQVTMYEQEPNDKPLSGNPFNAPITVLGNMQGKDQDLFVWDIKDADADYFWNIEFDGIPEHLTKLDVMQLIFTEDGTAVSKVNKLFTISNKGGFSSVKKSDLVFLPGVYYLGLSFAGTGKITTENTPQSPLLAKDIFASMDEKIIAENKKIDAIKVSDQIGYKLKFIKGKKINSPNLKQNSKEKTYKLRINRKMGLYFENKTIWMNLSIDEKQSKQVWQISGHSSVGNTSKLKLLDANGKVLTSATSDKYGYYALTDLSLSPGQHRLEISSQVSSVSSIEVKSTGFYVKGQEKEPNDNYKTANHFVIGETITASKGKKRDTDYFQFEVSEESSNKQLEIQLLNSQNSQYKLCLYTENETELQCKEKKEDIVLKSISLPAGSYLLGVFNGDVNAQYSVSVVEKGKRNAIQEAEPNDNYQSAKTMSAKRIVRGTFDGSEYDYFTFEVSKEPQLWTIQAIGNNMTALGLYDASGRNIQDQRFKKSQKRVRLSNLYLMPGKHTISIKGEDGKYLLRAFPIGKVDNSFEYEPNDSTSTAMSLTFGQVKKGLLQNKVDQDLYRFRLNNKEHIKLSIEPPTDGSIRYYIYWENQTIGRQTSKLGKSLVFSGLYPAGDYTLELQAAETVSDDHYRVELTRLSRFSCVKDCEPNDSAFQANLIAKDGLITGHTGTHEDYDWYKLAAFGQATKVTFKNISTQKNRSIRGFIDFNKTLDATIEPQTKDISFNVPAEKASYFRINKDNKPYEFQLLIGNQPVITSQQYSELSMQIKGLAKEVLAYNQHAQTLEAKLLINNAGNEQQIFKIIPTSSHYQWQLDVDEKSHTVAPGQTLLIPFTVKVPADAWRGHSVNIAFSTKNKQGILSETSQDIAITSNAKLHDPKTYWSIPEELLGGINVASTAMGGKRTAQDLKLNVNAVGRGFDKLFDGIAVQGDGMIYRGGRKTKQDYVTIKLAGDDAIDVKGIILNPLSKATRNDYLKDFELQLSSDGVNFQSVLKQQLQPFKSEQSFVLPVITQAKYARLYLLNSQDNTVKSQLSLGEWKVIASPSQVLSGETGYNIADPKHGGYVVWSQPESPGPWDINMLTEKKERKYARATDDLDWQWVVGFHHQRAAKITKIQWQHPEIPAEYSAFNKVKIAVSQNSPVGPWTFVAEKDLVNLKSFDEIVLDKPIWARYVKFTVPAIKKRDYGYFPETIAIFEQKADDNYHSILGEWGELSEQAIYEKLHAQIKPLKQDDINNNSKATAIDLSQKKSASGQVQLEYADKPDWYKFKIPPGQNTLHLTLAGNQTVKTVIHVEDEAGTGFSLNPISEDLDERIYQIPVKEGWAYYVKVEEPPRSVIFTWDTSGSTNAYSGMIYRAISTYSNDVIAGRDSVNFLPFGGNLLMEKWYGEPFLLKSILNDYPRNHDSSEAELSLFRASEQLKSRQGSKAIIVITDAITNRYAQMWDSFRQVQPRVFSIGIIGNGFGSMPDRQIDLMQSWSRVNNGEFRKVLSSADVELAFDRAATKLRQPAEYTLSMNSEFLKAPGPGRLLITQDLSAQDSAVELILDASGSMLKRMDGIRRIDIAKQVLIKAITETIPAKTPLALRVFGDKQANSCRTDLAIKLKPLEPITAKSVIEKIKAKNQAKTPIAASLAKVASDLKTHKGKKIVILVTDGEETCDGNPQDVIAKLIDDGIDIRLNIVGFAIDDEALKAQFNQWSTQGGGQYFDSNNPQSLKESIEQALKTPYSVFSQSGELIKQGTVNGESILLPAGFYTIKVFGSNVVTFEKYQIKGESEQTISLY